MLKDNVVSKSNELNLRVYQLSRTEQLLVLAVASMIQPDDDNFKIYRLAIKDFMNLLDVSDKSKYTELPKVCSSLMKKPIEIKKKHSLLQVNWFASAEHIPGEGIIEIELSTKLKPYLLELKNNFVSYALKYVAKLSSRYSIRIYELLKQMKFKKVEEFEISDFRDLIGLDDSIYPKYSNLKAKILLPAQKELAKLTDISFDFEEIKIGRKVASIKFFIQSNKVTTIDPNEEKKANKNIEYINQIKAIMYKHEIKDNEAMAIYKDAEGDLEHIKIVYENFKDKEVKTSFVGLMRSMVKPGAFNENKKQNSTFNNYDQRAYDMDELEKGLLGWKNVD